MVFFLPPIGIRPTYPPPPFFAMRFAEEPHVIHVIEFEEGKVQLLVLFLNVSIFLTAGFMVFVLPFLIFEVNGTLTGFVIAGAAFVALVALLGSLVPALKAARIDPSTVLRAE